MCFRDCWIAFQTEECFNELAGRIDDLSRQLFLKGTTFSAPGAEASEATDASKPVAVPLGEDIVSMKPTEEKFAQISSLVLASWERLRD